jgi:peptidoglycan hydrolase CwlO-like protein
MRGTARTAPPNGVARHHFARQLQLLGEMTADEDIATVASQLADLTRTVAEMETQLRALRERADSQQERADQQRERTEIQQERIDLAARELAEVSARLQSAANALREPV